MERQKTISLLNTVKSGKISATELKRLIELQKSAGKPIECPFSDELLAKVSIETDFSYVYLKDQISGPNGQMIRIVIGKRLDERFKYLEADSEYEITIPEPGVMAWDLTRYYGPMTFKAVLTESDFDY
jgi:hypothetical protein